MVGQLGTALEHPLAAAAALLLLGLIPFLALALTSFLKFSIVMGILRQALGAGQVPGAAVSSLIAVVLTI